ncbi:pol-like protein [Colletotrichum kahawae]|uniref:Pol-like protein n=1 Tax=Colletotrichum kahawae TaxID=34407 RepID=A0AAD9YBL9_COLKA|nr:pol-like protein [Colletotrichum kahawae]
MNSKLQIDAKAISGEESAFAYIYARLEGTAQATSSAFFADRVARGDTSLARFMDYLERTYRDLNAEARALDKLRTMQ